MSALEIFGWACGILLVGSAIGWVILMALNQSRGDGT